MEDLKEQTAAYLVSNVDTSFVGEFSDDIVGEIFVKDLADEYSAVSWVEFRHDGQLYQMYLARVK